MSHSFSHTTNQCDGQLKIIPLPKKQMQYQQIIRTFNNNKSYSSYRIAINNYCIKYNNGG